MGIGRVVRKVAIGCTAAIIGPLATGCALVSAEWNAQATHAPLPAVHVEIARADLERTCGGSPAMLTYGCAVRDYAANLCIVYTAPEPPGWLLAHEFKHCAGWDHAPERNASGT